jgi:hypothetical protein
MEATNVQPQKLNKEVKVVKEPKEPKSEKKLGSDWAIALRA